MHILIAAHGFPPTHSAGAELRAQRMVNWLVANGHKVTVFAVEKVDEPGFRVEARQENGYTIHRLFYDVSQGDAFRNLYDYHPIGKAFNQILQQQSFDLVHLISGYLLGGQVILAAHGLGIPVVLTLTEYWFMCTRLNLVQRTGALCSGPETDEKCMRCLMEDRRRFRLPATVAPVLMDTFWTFAKHLPSNRYMTQAISERRENLKKAMESADRVISPSQYLIDTFGRFGYDTSRFTFLRQGLATPINPRVLPLRDDADGLRIGYTGQIKIHKGVDLLIDSVIKLLDDGHKISLDLWGSETEEPDYVNMLKERSSSYTSIRWKGQYPGGKVWDVLAGFDLLVMPSRWYENSPNVILEAYQMKLPVLATNLGGMAELVEHNKTGLLFALNDGDDLYHQLERLLTEHGLLAKLQSNIPRIRTIDEEMHDIIEVYQTILTSRGSLS